MPENLKQKMLRAVRTFYDGDIKFFLSGLDVTVKGVPRDKILNWMISGLSAHLQLSHAFGYPPQIQIEPTARCNLSCLGCPSANILERNNSDLNFEIYCQLIDNLSDKLIAVTLFDWGEPFLNSKIYDMIEYANKKGIITSTNSNAHAFSNPQNAEKLVTSGLDLITFGIDGITQETYQKFRVNGNLDAVINGIKNIVHYKKLHNSTSPIINFRFIVMRHNEDEIPYLNKFAQDLGCDCLSLKTFNTYVGGINNPDLNKLAPLQKAYSRFSSGDEQKPIPRKKPICSALWNNPSIHCNGNLSICFNDHDDKTVIGNLADYDFKSLWNSKTFKGYRKIFSGNFRELERCRNCTLSFKGGDCAQEVQRDFYAFSKLESQRIKINYHQAGA